MTLTAIGLVAVSSKPQVAGVSLGEQEQAIRERCQQENWQLTELVKLPGVSRSDPDIIEMFAGREPKYAPYRRLRELINSQAANILISYDDGRVGRSKSMFVYIAENAVANQMRVLVLTSGWIDSENEDYAIALGSIKATADMKRRVKMRDKAIAARAVKGLNVGRYPFSHRAVRDDRGKTVRLEVNEALRPLFNDLADLLLARVGWDRIVEILLPRYHHRGIYRLYDLLYNPYFWGHSGRRYSLKRDYTAAGVATRGNMWAFDPEELPPPGVIIHYNTHDAVYTGERAALIKAELRRRHETARGRSYQNRAFSGLIVCGACGRRIVAHHLTGQVFYWRCRGKCANRAFIKNDHVQAYLDLLLREMVKAGGPALLERYQNPVEDFETRLKKVRAEMGRAENQLRNLIDKQTTAPSAAQVYYTEKIAEVSATLNALQNTLNTERENQALAAEPLELRQQAWSHIARIGVDVFWTLAAPEQNQLLLGLFGKLRLVGQDGQIARMRQL